MLQGIAPPNADLNEDIRADYVEATGVAQVSPRAAALLRLCLQKVCAQVGLPGKNLNDDIAALVARGLNPEIQQALDSVRVIGNNAVHPLEMNLQDDTATANALFELINYIAEQMISFPVRRERIFASLPEDARKAIENRDARSKSGSS
jgi:hypothetical protein